MKAPKTNVQKITHLMTLNPGGPLAQVMILEAVRQYCSSVVAAGRPADNPTGIISAPAWYDTGLAIASQLDHWSNLDL